MADAVTRDKFAQTLSFIFFILKEFSIFHLGNDGNSIWVLCCILMTAKMRKTRNVTNYIWHYDRIFCDVFSHVFLKLSLGKDRPPLPLQNLVFGRHLEVPGLTGTSPEFIFGIMQWVWFRVTNWTITITHLMYPSMFFLKMVDYPVFPFLLLST